MEKGRRDVRQLNNKSNVIVYVAATLLLLVGLSTCFLSGLYARYVAEGSGNDSARVASFSVAAINDSDNSDLAYVFTDDPFAAYAITLQNKSEVAVSSDIIVELSDELPSGVKMNLADGSVGTVSDDGKIYTFEKVSQLAVASEDTVVLQFVPDTTDSPAEFENEKYKDIEWSTTRTIEIEVEFVQID